MLAGMSWGRDSLLALLHERRVEHFAEEFRLQLDSDGPVPPGVDQGERHLPVIGLLDVAFTVGATCYSHQSVGEASGGMVVAGFDQQHQFLVL